MKSFDPLKEMYSIVVVGNMNPMIHHPKWYQSYDLLSPSECDESLKDSETFILHRLAQFTIPAFTITCEIGKWQIRTDNVSERERILQVAKRVFGHDLLYHTPVASFGLNCDYEVNSNMPNIGEILAQKVSTVGLEAELDGNCTSSMTFRCQQESRIINITVRPVPAVSSAVHVGSNTHYTIQGPGVQFDLGVLLDQHFQLDYDAAYARTYRIIASLQGEE